MSMIKTSIKQPVLVNLLTVLVLVAGAIYGMRNTKEIMPDVTIPAVSVRTLYPGISARDMEKLVTKPIEDAVADVSELDHIYSTSHEGMSFIWLEFAPDTDLDTAVQNVQNKIEAIGADLPPDTEKPVVTKAKHQTPVIQVALTAPISADLHLLRANAERLRDRLEGIKDVSKVDVAGLRKREIRVVLDPNRLQAYRLTGSQVYSTISMRNRNFPGGTIRSGAKEMVLRPINEYASLEEIRNTIVVKRADGQHVRVGDVAQVTDTFVDRQTGGWVDGKPGVVFSIVKRSGADGHEVVARVKKTLKKQNARLPAGFATKLFGDTTRQVDRTIDTLFRNAAMGMALVLALLWVFLGLRNAFFATLGIPFAFAGGVVIMYLLGVTINSVSLFALIICTGIIVDDAIVVVENTYRYMEQGFSAPKAALLGSKEVMWPVISTVVTTVAAFLPLLLMTGVMGQFFAVIPKVVVAVLITSLLEALVVLPSHVAEFGKLKTQRRKKRQNAQPERKKANVSQTQRLTTRLRGLYRRSAGWVLRHRYAVVFTAVAVAVGCTALTVRYKEMVLFGDVDSEMIDIRVEMSQSSSLEATEAVLRKVEQRVATLNPKHITAVLSQSGWSRRRLFPEAGKHLGMVTLMLTPTDTRQTTAEEIMARLRPRLADIPGPVKPIEVVKLKHGPPTGAPVAIRLQGDDGERLLALAETVERELAQIRGVQDIGRDYHRGRPELRLEVDTEKAALHQLDPASVSQAIMLAYTGREATKYRRANDEIPVTVRYPDRLRNDPTGLAALPLLQTTASASTGVSAGTTTGGTAGVSAGTTSGGTAGVSAGTTSGNAASPNTASGTSAALQTGSPKRSSATLASLSLGDVVRIRRDRAPAAIQRRDRKRTITVTANLDAHAGVTAQGVNRKAQKRLAPLMAANRTVRFTFGGEFEKLDESLSSLFSAFVVALLAIYLILGAQFRSFVQPLVVLLAVPLSIIGVVVGFFVAGTPIDLIALIGVVGLAGIVVNDSLILVDFINTRRRQGVARDEAIKTAGALRLRPILLTTVTTVFGMLPIAMGWGGAVPELAPMAAAIVWGLSFATVLILFVVPSAYAIIDDGVCACLKLFGKKPRWVRTDLAALDSLDNWCKHPLQNKPHPPGTRQPPDPHNSSPEAHTFDCAEMSKLS
jgi:multidrug efflux pump subunit AcrB